MRLFKKVCNVHVPAVTAHINFIKSHTSACSTDKFLYTVKLKLSTLTIANIIIQLAKCVKNLNKTNHHYCCKQKIKELFIQQFANYCIFLK